MSFSIYNNHNELVFRYNENNHEIKFHSLMLENDISEGISIPFYMQQELSGKKFVKYPPEAEEVSIFALVYKRAIFEKELVKHDYRIEED